MEHPNALFFGETPEQANALAYPANALHPGISDVLNALAWHTEDGILGQKRIVEDVLEIINATIYTGEHGGKNSFVMPEMDCQRN